MGLPHPATRALQALQSAAVYASARYAEHVCSHYWARSTRTHRDLSAESFDFYYSHIRNAISPNKGERIFDFGCGGGEIAMRFQRDGYDVVGVDISEPLLEQARALGVTVYRWTSKGEAEGMPPARFEHVFANNAFLYVHPRRRAALLRRLRALLVPGGTLRLFDEPDHAKRERLGHGRAWMALTAVAPTFEPAVAAFFTDIRALERSAREAGFQSVTRTDSWCDYRSHFVLK